MVDGIWVLSFHLKAFQYFYLFWLSPRPNQYLYILLLFQQMCSLMIWWYVYLCHSRWWKLVNEWWWWGKSSSSPQIARCMCELDSAPNCEYCHYIVIIARIIIIIILTRIRRTPSSLYGRVNFLLTIIAQSGCGCRTHLNMPTKWIWLVDRKGDRIRDEFYDVR